MLHSTPIALLTQLSLLLHHAEHVLRALPTQPTPLLHATQLHSVTSETDAGLAQKQLRRLDPYFDLEEWKADLVTHLLPEVMGAWLKGDTAVLRQWLSGAVLAKLEAETLNMSLLY
jgi:Tim44-like domain